MLTTKVLQVNLVIASGLIWSSVLLTSEAKVKLVKNGYEGVIIAINPDIPEDKNLLTRLETFLTETSQTLFRATRNLLYFREFVIVVPEKWKPRQVYENAMDVKLDKAQIIIDRPNPSYGDAPYVKQYAKCGQPGLYIHLTPGYLLDDAIVHKWGRPDKTLVHEWAHLRWGLFDEYPIDDNDAAFYRHGQYWEPTRCSREVDGSILNEFTSRPCTFDFQTGKPEKDCRFFPRMADNKAASSLMFMQYLESIVEFCDDPNKAPKQLQHNVLAPNRQNRLCMSKSSWEVMKEHADFHNISKPLPDSINTKPRFLYVQAHPRKRVLVLDTSGSMTGASLNVLKQAASNYILSCIETGSKLGIVQFSTNASALSTLKEVNSETDRLSLIDALPTTAEGKTSIGSGLKKAVEVLKTGGEAPGGSIILITDGKENAVPYLKDLRPDLMKQGIIVHALAYGQRAEQSIAELSQDTGGKTFFYSGSYTSTAFMDGMAATVAAENTVIPQENPQHSILTEAGIAKRGTPLVGKFYIDSTIGKETSLTVSYTEKIKVQIQGPHGTFTKETHPENFRSETTSKVVKILLPDNTEVGLWRYKITTSSEQSLITINIQSKSRKSGTDVVQVRSWIPDMSELHFTNKLKFGVYAEVTRGKAPVLNATVIATIERPQSGPVAIQLNDDGVGADIIKSDGVYASYIMARDVMGDGRYNIKVDVKGTDDKTKVIVGGGRSSSGALQVEESEQTLSVRTKSLETFQRVTSAGEFRLKDFPAASSDQIKDEMAPSRITDFRISSFDYDNLTLSLQWTAVGGDMERGKAHHYIIYHSGDFHDVMHSQKHVAKISPDDVIEGDLHNPAQSGNTEHIILVVRELEENSTIFMVVVAVDEIGNHGDTSNIVSVSVARETIVPRVPIKTSLSLNTYLIIAIPLIVAILVILIITVIMLVLRAKKIRSEKIEQVEDNKTLSQSTLSLDLEHMNYMFDGEYRKRLPEENIDTWSRDSLGDF